MRASRLHSRLILLGLNLLGLNLYGLNLLGLDFLLFLVDSFDAFNLVVFGT